MQLNMRVVVMIGMGMMLRQYLNISPVMFLALAAFVALRERFWGARRVD